MHRSADRIVITGSGIVCAIGLNKQECLDSLVNSKCGIDKAAYLKTEHMEFPVGEVKMSDEEMRERLNEPDASRSALLGIMAIEEALQEAALTDHDNLALVSGTTVGGMSLTENGYPEAVTSNILRQHDCGGCTNLMADHFGNFSFVTTCSTACSSSINSIILGKNLIESRQCDIVVCGGTESLSRFHLNGFKSLLILDDEPCKPFDINRKGLNLGEGAGYVVLESESSALKRGVSIQAVLDGVGNACDAYHQTASSPDGTGAYLAMQRALEDAGLTPKQIDYINMHGTATPDNDACESKAIRRLFDSQLPLLSSTKGMTGHTTSASGSIETIFCILCLQHGIVPANVGFHDADPNCIVPLNHVVRQPIHRAMCNSFGFGGNDSSLIVSRYEK